MADERPDTDHLWFTDQSVSRIGRITPLGVVTEFSASITNDARPRDITPGPDGNLRITELRDRIGRITPPAPPPVLVVEYHRASFDHFFITPVAAEIALLDARAPSFQE